MKKMILASILGLMSAVSFAQTTVAPGEPNPHKHTREDVKAAAKDCRTNLGKPTDKKAHHEAMKKCMEDKGFKHMKKHDRKNHPPVKPTPPVVEPVKK